MIIGTQITEIIGRNLLVNELLAANLEVAMPLRDRGVDLIAYAEIGGQTGAFHARPIQLKASSRAIFSIHRKYERISDLIVAFVWYLAEPRESVIYALAYAESLAVATQVGWTATSSRTVKGACANNQPTKKLVALLEPHRVDPEKWRKLICG